MVEFDAIETEKRLLRHLIAECFWRSMETAPKDGTSILGHFPPIANVPCTYDHEVQETWWSGDRWVTVHPEQQPTHWMPLPLPPKTQEKSS